MILRRQGADFRFGTELTLRDVRDWSANEA
jgi:hypothetical protein